MVNVTVAAGGLPLEPGPRGFRDMCKRKIRLLLVDDNDELVLHLRKRLNARGLAVVGAGNGDAAIAAAKGQTFDVAVVDLKMPGPDGVETTEALKYLQPELEVIILTGHGSVESAFACGQRHAYRFLHKPLDIDQLMEEIKLAYSAKRRTQQRAYQEELDEVINANRTPRAILEEARRLRARYDLVG